MYTFFHIIYFSLSLSLSLFLYLSIFSIYLSIYLSFSIYYTFTYWNSITRAHIVHTSSIFTRPLRHPTLVTWNPSRKKKNLLHPCIHWHKFKKKKIKKRAYKYTRVSFQEIVDSRISTIINSNFLSRYVGVSRRKVQPWRIARPCTVMH